MIVHGPPVNRCPIKRAIENLCTILPLEVINNNVLLYMYELLLAGANHVNMI